jgi:hypothetical protein
MTAAVEYVLTGLQRACERERDEGGKKEEERGR